MTIARLRRLQRLESRQPRGPVRRDPFDAIMRLWPELQAVAAGKACWVPRPPSERSEETKDAFDRQMAEYDSMHSRLTAKLPEAA